MPNTSSSKRKVRQETTKLAIQLPRELSKAIVEKLHTKPEPLDEKGFWSWLKEHGTSIATLFTILSAVIGGLWTFNQYIDQQRQAETARQQEVIARFAGDLADPIKRNSAVYALAVLADDEVVPLLVYQLQEEALSQNDESYRNALVQALTTLGEPSLEPVIDLNRRITQTRNAENIEKISGATSPIILSFFTSNPELLRTHPDYLREIYLSEANLSGLDLSKLTFTKVGFVDTLFCVVNLSETSFDGGSIYNSFWAGAYGRKLSYSHLEFQNANFVLADIKGTNLLDVRMFNSNLSGVFLSGSVIKDSVFSDNLMGVGYFDQSTITNTVFIDSDLNNAKFFVTKFNSGGFFGANLENADFRNADLTDVDFYIGDPDTKPNTTFFLGSSGWDTRGSFVRDADFEGATNLNEAARIYLCKWGAENIPGGCNGIQPEDLSVVPRREYEFNTDVGECGP